LSASSDGTQRRRCGAAPLVTIGACSFVLTVFDCHGETRQFGVSASPSRVHCDSRVARDLRVQLLRARCASGRAAIDVDVLVLGVRPASFVPRLASSRATGIGHAWTEHRWFM
jgi:hypothetical protein